jgi:hypothetical protein
MVIYCIPLPYLECLDRFFNLVLFNIKYLAPSGDLVFFWSVLHLVFTVTFGQVSYGDLGALPPSQITICSSFSRCIAFDMHLDIYTYL